MSTSASRRIARLAVLGALALLVSACAGSPDGLRPVMRLDGGLTPADATRFYQEGKEALARGNLGLAGDAFQTAVLADPGSVNALNALAATYDRMGRFDLADRYYRHALALDPASVETLNNVGWSYLMRGDPAGARVYLEQAGAIEPENPVVQINLAILEHQPAVDAPLAASAPAPTPPSAAPPERWVERSGPSAYTLVMAPDPDRLLRLTDSDLPVWLTNVSQVDAAESEDWFGSVTTPWRPDAAAPARAAAAVVPPRRPDALDLGALSDVAVILRNGAGRDGMAARLRNHLVFAGVDVVGIENAESFDHRTTVIHYRDGQLVAAQRLAELLSGQVELRAAADVRVSLEVVLGADLLAFDQQLSQEDPGHAKA